MADQVAPELRDKIIHVSMIVGEGALLGGDTPPDSYEEPKGLSVTIQLEDTAEAERVFSELSESGTVTMPIQQTFWAARFGMCVDRFGIPWMINCGQGQGE
jgi:PhnB protein